MPICPHGSEPKPGMPAALVLTPANLSLFLPAGFEWLRPYLPYLPPVTIVDVGAFCALDPPDLPTITGFDVFNLIVGGRIGLASTSVQKFVELIQAYAWYSMCHCLVDSTPAPPTAPAAPTGLPAIDPPNIVPPVPVSPCRTQNDDQGVLNAGVSSFVLARVLFAGVPATSVRLTFHNPVTVAPGFQVNFQVQLIHHNPGLVVDQTINNFVNAGATALATYPIVPGQDLIWVTVSASAGSGENHPTVTTDFFCGVVPGSTVQPCCPPDPQLMATLNQVRDLVEIVQRQAAPFGYVSGAVHAGLSGSGQFAVADLLGLAVDLTTTPGYAGVRAGDPVQLYEIGRVNVGTADGWSHFARVDSDPWLWFPAAAGTLTLVGYSFEPGVVATVRELVREP